MGIQINGQTDIISATDGSLTVQGADLSSVTNLNASGISTFAVITGVSTAGITTAYIGSINDGPISGTRNRIINGDMRIDQRNAGASISVSGDGFGNRVFPVDRFPLQRNSTCVISGIQTSDVPTGQGFSYALKAQVTTADTSIAASDYAFINYRHEGYNVADLQYGTSNAKTATLSFWVKSSISGTYCVAIANYADNRGIPINYSINSADTWEYKTITISGDVTGTWEKTNSGGMNMFWVLASGTDYQATNNTWAGLKLSTSSQTQWISTLNATFYITGVQLEVGTVATPFERRSYGQELALCQRYYTQIGDGGNPFAVLANGRLNSSTSASFRLNVSVQMRATPTATLKSATYALWEGTNNRSVGSFALYSGGGEGYEGDLTTSGATTGAYVQLRGNASSPNDPRIFLSAEL